MFGSDPTVMLRRNLIEAGFAFPEKYQTGVDISLWIRLVARFGLLGVDQPLTLVRPMPGGTAGILDRQYQGLANVAAAVRAESGSRRNRWAATFAAGDNHHRRTRCGKGVGPPGLTDVAANWKAL
jgi:hypothetical protein